MSVRDRLASFIGRTPPDDGPDYDAHTWDDASKPSLRERLTPSTQRGWAATVSTVTIGIGLGVYFLRFLPVRDIVVPTISIALLPWVAIWARRGLRDRFGDLAWSILFDGRSASVRFGELERAGERTALVDEDVVEDGWIFSPAVSMSLTGELSYLQVRDVFGTRELLRNKVHRTGTSGEAPCRDYLPETWTSTVETDTIGTVSITLTDGLTKLPRASDIDRAATTPSLFPTSLAGDIKAVLSELAETQLPALQRRLEMEERRAEELSRPSDERVRQQLDDAVSIMVAAGVTSGDEYERQVQRRRSGSSPGIAPRPMSTRGRQSPSTDRNGQQSDAADDALSEIDDAADEAVGEGDE